MTGFKSFTQPFDVRVLIAVLLLVLSGCQTKNASNIDSVADAGTDQISEPDHQLPNVELSKQLLEQVMSAEVLIRRGDSDEAVSQILSAAKLSRDPRLASKAAYWALQSGLFKKAKQAGQLWLDIVAEHKDGDLTPARIVLADALIELHETEQALSLYQLAIKETQDEDIYKRISSEMSRLKNTENLISIYQKLLDQAVDREQAFVGLAILAARLNDFEKSRSAVDESLALNPSNQDAALIKLSYLMEDQVEEPIDQFAKGFLRKNADSNRFRMEYARYLSGTGQYEESIKQFLKIPDSDDQHYHEASLSIIALAMDQEDYGLADKRLVKLLDIDPTDSRLVFYRCQVQRELANYDLASELCNEISFGDFYFPAQLELSDIQADRGELDRALGHLDSIPVSGIDEQIRVYLRKQQLLYKEDQLQRSLTVLTEGLIKYPDNTSLLYARGLILSELGKVHEHERDMRRLIKLDPENPHVYNALGYTLADLTNRYDEALELITKAIELNPDDAYILDSLGWVHFKLNNFDQAQVHLEQAFDLSGDAEIAAHLGELYWVIGEKDRAKSVWRKAKKQTPDNKVLNRTLERFL